MFKVYNQTSEQLLWFLLFFSLLLYMDFYWISYQVLLVRWKGGKTSRNDLAVPNKPRIKVNYHCLKSWLVKITTFLSPGSEISVRNSIGRCVVLCAHFAFATKWEFLWFLSLFARSVCIYILEITNEMIYRGVDLCVLYIWGESNRVCRFLILHGEMRERAFLTKGICMCVRLSLRLKCLIWRRSITYI